MHGVSEVIAIILILMITISLAGLAYMFMSTTMSDVTSSAGSTVDTTTSSMLTSFTIESMDVANVYVRNTGQNPLTSLSVYVNDEPAVYNITPPSISTGTIGTITVYSFIPDGSTVKVSSPSGFSASKVAQPCSKAVGCWKLDEGSGLAAYDSSPYGNIGTLINGTNWTSGRYGNALLFDGINDYVNSGNSSTVCMPSVGQITVEAWVYPIGNMSQGIVVRKENEYSLRVRTDTNVIHFDIYNGTAWYWSWTTTSQTILNGWHHIVGVANGSNVSIYIDGVRKAVSQNGVYVLPNMTVNNLQIGSMASNFFNGSIDEVRIYNRAIY